MTDDNAHAAGESGAETMSAPRAAPRHGDDAYRRFAVEELALHLARGGNLLARCNVLADAADDTAGPILAAARLMNANAKIAKALTEAMQTERRSRTIIEVVQRPDPEIAGLNSTFALPENRKARRLALRRYLLQLLQDGPKPRQALAIAGEK